MDYVEIILFQTIESTGLDSLEKEPVTLSGSHVISPEQLFVGTIRKGESGVEFKNVYSNRENRSMFDGMADALTKIRLSSPGRGSRTVQRPRKITFGGVGFVDPCHRWNVNFSSDLFINEHCK